MRGSCSWILCMKCVYVRGCENTLSEVWMSVIVEDENEKEGRADPFISIMGMSAL